MRVRERHVGEHIGLGLVDKGGKVWRLETQLIGDPAPLCPGTLGIVLSEGGSDDGGDDASARTSRQRGTPLPTARLLDPSQSATLV